MLEVLSPAGSLEGVTAAVQNGANAIYLGLADFNARRNAKNLTEEDLARAIEYCHIRDVKVYVTMNTLVTDRELVQIERTAKTISRLGADAIIVQDLGAMGTIRQVLPEMPLHASTQMGIHNLEGVEKAAFFGASRVILARELSLAHIAYIQKQTNVELEVFCHGALCMSYSGQCYLSAVIGGRSGNRGLCAQPCRLPYQLDGNSGHHLSLKDYNLADHLGSLEKLGVACVKIEGRMKRPEYTAIVTKIYSDLIREKRKATKEEHARLRLAFSRDGFTDGYLTGEKGTKMFGVRGDGERKQEQALFDEVRRGYLHNERKCVPIRFFAMIEAGKPAKLAVQDNKDTTLRVEGPIPQAANTKALSKEDLLAQLSKTGGTPYYCDDIQIVLDDGLFLPIAELNQMRRSLLEELTKARGAKPSMPPEKLFRPGNIPPQRELPPQLNVSLLQASQLTEEFFALKPSLIYMPIDEILEQQETLMPFLTQGKTPFVATLPQIILDDEKESYKQKLAQIQELGIKQVLVSHMGHIDFCKKQGLAVRGDFGFHVMNGLSLKSLKHLPLESVTLSFECKMAQIRDMPKHMDTELIAYGRVPVMITENCVLSHGKNHGCDTPHSLIDRQGASFPVIKSGPCRSEVYNSRKLFLADKAADYMDIGLWGVRLCFTTENPRECVEILKRYLNLGTYEPGGYTRGLYYRGVE